jgi:hypothetical protein
MVFLSALGKIPAMLVFRMSFASRICCVLCMFIFASSAARAGGGHPSVNGETQNRLSFNVVIKPGANPAAKTTPPNVEVNGGTYEVEPQEEPYKTWLAGDPSPGYYWHVVSIKSLYTNDNYSKPAYTPRFAPPSPEGNTDSRSPTSTSFITLGQPGKWAVTIEASISFQHEGQFYFGHKSKTYEIDVNGLRVYYSKPEVRPGVRFLGIRVQNADRSDQVNATVVCVGDVPGGVGKIVFTPNPLLGTATITPNDMQLPAANQSRSVSLTIRAHNDRTTGSLNPADVEIWAAPVGLPPNDTPVYADRIGSLPCTLAVPKFVDDDADHYTKTNGGDQNNFQGALCNYSRNGNVARWSRTVTFTVYDQFCVPLIQSWWNDRNVAPQTSKNVAIQESGWDNGWVYDPTVPEKGYYLPQGQFLQLRNAQGQLYTPIIDEWCALRRFAPFVKDSEELGSYSLLGSQSTVPDMCYFELSYASNAEAADAQLPGNGPDATLWDWSFKHRAEFVYPISGETGRWYWVDANNHGFVWDNN